MVRFQNATILLLWCLSGVTRIVGQESVSAVIAKIDPITSCTSLKGMRIPAAMLGLPTAGAYVWSAKLVHDSRGEYCKVLGGVRPTDSSAQDIRFEVNLSTSWNHKAVQFGGGAFELFRNHMFGKATPRRKRSAIKRLWNAAETPRTSLITACGFKNLSLCRTAQCFYSRSVSLADNWS
jgi:hypothetical protein